MQIRTGLFVAAIAVSAPLQAQDHAVGARLGLLGVGVEYSYRISERLAIRGGVNGSGLSSEETESGIDYDFDLDFDSTAIGVDVHPMKGAFRVSVGFLANDSAIKATGLGNGSITIGNDTYTADQIGTLRGSISFDSSTAPFVGLGWDFRHEKRVGVALDFGVVDQGAPIVRLSADGPLASDPVFQDNLAAEQAELQESVDDLDVYPFASLGVVFRF